MRFRTLALLFAPIVACGAFSSTGGNGSSSSGSNGGTDAGGEGGSSSGTVSGGGTQPGNGAPLVGIFVSSASTAASPDGSMASPFAKISDAITAAAASGKTAVLVCADGTYTESIVMQNGVSVWGSYSCAGGTWAYQKTQAALKGGNIAVTANGITNGTTLADFDITAADGVTSAPSSIGLLASGSQGLAVSGVSIQAGVGLKGADGVEPAALVNDPSANASGISGGTNTCGNAAPASLQGVGGGNGATKGVYICMANKFAYQTMPGNRGVVTGTPTQGTAGASCTSGGTYGANGYITCDGTLGTDGTGGVGGDGAFSGGDVFNQACGSNGMVVNGSDGEGGGAGGCGGIAGPAGIGGGASIAVLEIDQAIAFDSVTLLSMNGGDGGKGTGGSIPGAGGTGANAGTPGALPGISGSGGGGPSACIVYSKSITTAPDPKIPCTAGAPGHGVDLYPAPNGNSVPASADGAGGPGAPVYSFSP